MLGFYLFFGRFNRRGVGKIVSTIKAVLPGDIHKVWDIVLDVRNYNWWSDLSRAVAVSEKIFWR